MTHSGDIDRLAERIRRILLRGVSSGAEIDRYIESTLEIPTPAALAALLDAPDECESAPLLELIFFPDRKFQAQIEECLLGCAFNRSDESALVRCLQNRPPVTTITYGAKRRRLTAVMPNFVAGPFVARLCIWKQPDSRLAAGFKRHLPDGHRLTALVLVRNTHCKPDAEAVDLLCRLVQNADARLDPDALVDHLAWALALMEDLPQAMLMSEYLAKRRADCLAALKTAEQVAARQQDGPMEAFIMGRVPAPYVDPTATRRQIVMIDTVCELTR